MDKRPDWVPEWIWGKYLEVKNDRSKLTASSSTKLDAIMADPRCEVVWKAITKRRGQEFKTFRETRGIKLKPSDHWDDVQILLCRIPIMASGLSNEDKISSRERSRQGRKIARTSAELRTALLETRVANRWPYPLSGELEVQTYKMMRATGANHNDLCGWERDAIWDHCAALDSLCGALLALRQAGEAWASWKSVISHPKDGNASRLMFIREMTAFFRRMYDGPLRECVAALTNCLYDCDIDAATVAKLAP